MTDIPDPGHLGPATVGAVIAIAVRAAIADKPRPWRVVILDGVATACLSVVGYYFAVGLPGALGGPVSPEFAIASSVLAAILGWAALVRLLRRILGITEG